MGRSFGEPYIVDTGDDFRIQRMRDPDDEFATFQLMDEGFAFVDVDRFGEPGRRPFRVPSRAFAESVLLAWKAGVAEGEDLGWDRGYDACMQG